MGYFNLKNHHTTYRTEFFAGITMFLAVSYVFFVSAALLETVGMDYRGTLIAMLFSSVVVTLGSVIYTKLPVVMAPIIGINQVFVLFVCGNLGLSWQMALFASYVAAVLAYIGVLLGWVDKGIRILPNIIRKSIYAGIGLRFIFIGSESTGLIKKNADTFYQWGSFCTVKILAVFAGVLIIYQLRKRKNAAAFILGLLVTFLLGYALMGGDFFLHKVYGGRFSFSELGKVAFGFPEPIEIIGHASVMFKFIVGVLCLSIVNMLEITGSVSTIFYGLRLGEGAHKKSSIQRLALVDSAGKIFASVMGSASLGTHTMSLVGNVMGGTTGVSSFVAAMGMLIMLFSMPFWGGIPLFVMAPVLLYVGYKLLESGRSQINGNLAELIAGWFIILFLGITSDFTGAIVYGMWFYVVTLLLTKKKELIKKEYFIFLLIGLIYWSI